MIIPYDASAEQRDAIVKAREKRLFQSFETIRSIIDEQIAEANMFTVSERVGRQRLEEIRYSLQQCLEQHYSALEAGLKSDMVEAGESVLTESEQFYTNLQMPIGMSITSFPVEIMNNIVNGTVYQEKWFLSKALWGDYAQKTEQINEIIERGVALNLPTLDIAKQLEQFVDPSAMTPSKTIVTPCLRDPDTGKLYSMEYVKRHPEKDWSGFTEKNSYFRFGKVDYNAQRLARTLIAHAYQQNVVHQAKANPFATGVKWIASGGERMCEICENRDGKIFPADEVPLDHPNGMCTFGVVTDLNMMEMSDVLADFVNGVPTEYDDALYDWYNDRAATPEEKPVNQDAKESFDKDKWMKMLAANDLDDMRQLTKEWLKNITGAERRGVITYSGIAAYEMNAYLRGSLSKISSAYKNAIENCSSALSKASLSDDVIVRRGADYNMLNSIGLGSISPDEKSSAIGAIVEDLGFMSTSPDPKGGFRYRDIEYVIKVPKGSHAMYIAPIFKHESENELLIDKGGRYIVEDVEFGTRGRDSDQVSRIYMTLINLR